MKNGERSHTEAEMKQILKNAHGESPEVMAVAERVMKDPNSVEWHKTPEDGPWTGRTVVEDMGTEDVLVGEGFPNRAKKESEK
jgi:hypothetical protein